MYLAFETIEVYVCVLGRKYALKLILKKNAKSRTALEIDCKFAS